MELCENKSEICCFSKNGINDFNQLQISFSLFLTFYEFINS